MVLKDRRTAFHRLGAILHGLRDAGKRGLIRDRTGVLFLAVVLAMAFCACKRPMPELEPDKFTSVTPGKPYDFSGDKRFEARAPDKLPGLSQEPSPSRHRFTLAQLVDEALRINPSTREAWAQARASAAAWGAARGSYYPTISADVAGAGGKFPQTSALGAFSGIFRTLCGTFPGYNDTWPRCAVPFHRSLRGLAG